MADLANMLTSLWTATLGALPPARAQAATALHLPLAHVECAAMVRLQPRAKHGGSTSFSGCAHARRQRRCGPRCSAAVADAPSDALALRPLGSSPLEVTEACLGAHLTSLGPRQLVTMALVCSASLDQACAARTAAAQCPNASSKHHRATRSQAP